MRLLVVNISTDLKVGKLLGEKNEWKMKLGYEGNMKEHSFFIHLMKTRI